MILLKCKEGPRLTSSVTEAPHMQSQAPSVAHMFCPHLTPPPPILSACRPPVLKLPKLVPTSQPSACCSHCSAFTRVGSFPPPSRFPLSCHPSEKPSSVPVNPYPFTQLYFSSKRRSLPLIVRPPSLFLYMLSISPAEGQLHIHCDEQHGHGTEWVSGRMCGVSGREQRRLPGSGQL